MTLARTALRLCVVGALDGATVAGHRVYDSQIVDFDPEVYMGAGAPAITVLTDQDEGDALSDQNGGPPFRRMIECVIEISILQALPLAGETDPDTGLPYPVGAYRVTVPDTDRRSEVSLDFLEYQVVNRLQLGADPICVLFRSFNRIVKFESHRQTDDGTAQKIASRIMTLTCDTADDQMPQPGLTLPTPPFGALPEPMRSVAGSFAEGTPGYMICLGLVDAITPVVLPHLDGMDFVIDAAPGADNAHKDEIRFDQDLP